MDDIRTPGDPNDSDREVIAALCEFSRSEAMAPDEVLRRRHLRAMGRARLGRRPGSLVGAAAAIVVLVAGVAIIARDGGSDDTNRVAEGASSGDPVLNASVSDSAQPDATATPVTPPKFNPDSPITAIPTERTEDYVILKVAASRAAGIEAELTAALGDKVATIGKTSSATTFVVPSSVARQLSDTSGVAVFPDSPVSSVAQQSPVPSWGLDRVDALDSPLDDSYSWTNSGTGAIIYVVDTGVYSAHSDFDGRVVSGYSAIDDGRGTDDCNGHGTHVAGTVAGQKYGIAKTASVVAVRVLDCAGSGYSSGVVAGINWVTANHPGGPGIINLSLGGAANSAIDTAVTDAVEAGLVVVVAAGNSADDACSYSPARVPAAITVGAIDISDAQASYSNFGSCVDMWAPGTQITSAWISGANASNTISGTSMASPHVAGLAARVLAMNPTLTPTDVNARLVRTNGSATTPIVNLVETPDDTIPSTTTSVPEATTTLPDTTTTSVDDSTTTTLPDATTTTTSSTTAPKPQRPGKGRRATSPKEFSMKWETENDVTNLVAEWTIQSPAERYKITCTQLALGTNAPIDSEFEFDSATTRSGDDEKTEVTVALVPARTLRCQLVAFVGSDASAPSNPAIVPPAPRKPVAAPTTTLFAPSTTIGTPPTSTTVPETPTTTTLSPPVTNGRPSTETSTTTQVKKPQGPPATSKRPKG